MNQQNHPYSAPLAGTVLAVLLLLSACTTTPTDNNTNVEAVAATTEMTTDAAAQQAYAAEDWQKVSELYGQLTKEQPGNGRYWYRLAVGLRYTGQFDAAGNALDEAVKVQVPLSYTAFERAKIAADQNLNAEAMAYLQTAAGAGLAGREMVHGNEHFVALVGVPGYEELLQQLETNKYPCGDSRFREFDFWVGEWQVATADGQIAGTNKISAREQDCMLLEEWTSASGNTGTSMNFLDLAKGKWVQQWVSSGVQIYLEGGLADGSMVLEGFIYYLQQNNQVDFRGTWTLLEDGRVRQFFEQSDDVGNWSPWFEGFYTRITDAE